MRLSSVLFPLLIPLVFGRFLGSEVTARMSAPSYLILFSLFIISLIVLFRLFGFQKRKHFSLKLIYISILFCIYIDFYLIRTYFSSCCFIFFHAFLIMNVSGREVIPHSGPSTPPSWTEDSFDIQVLLEPFPESETTGETPVNPREARPAVPANPVASRGEEAGPSNRVPPRVPYPYPPDEIIGGDCVCSIQRRLLAEFDLPSYEQIQFARIQAEDLFEVKVDILRIMAVLDPTGDWMGRGARALDNPRTATGEPSLEQLYALLEDLNRGGVQSGTYSDLKSRMVGEREGDRDDNSVT